MGGIRPDHKDACERLAFWASSIRLIEPNQSAAQTSLEPKRVCKANALCCLGSFLRCWANLFTYFWASGEVLFAFRAKRPAYVGDPARGACMRCTALSTCFLQTGSGRVVVTSVAVETQLHTNRIAGLAA